MGDGSRLEFMDNMDIYALFGNALDNAIESVIQEEREEDRVISFRIGSIGNVLGIHFENHVGHPVKLQNGLPVTEKADKRYHGFGVLSMKRIAEKYGGNLRVHVEEQRFCLDIMIPNIN